MDREFWKALFMRSVHAIWETAVSTAPATIVITPVMIEHFDWGTAKGVFFAVVAWALTAIFSGVLSAAKSMKVGMPEVNLQNTLELLGNDPDDFADEEDDEYEDPDNLEEGDE